jgi:sec-independent protein translocase protein TatA
MRLGPLEIILILVLALVLFGGKKLAGVGKALGQSIKEFKKEMGPDGNEKNEETPPEDDKNA